MKLFKRVSALALAGALTFGCLTGCESKQPAPEFTVPESIDLTTVTDPYAAISGMSGDTVVAVAGETEITMDHLLYWIVSLSDNLTQYYSMYGLSTGLPWESEPEEGVTLADKVKSNALKTAALYALLPDKAEEEGLELSEEFTQTLNGTLESLAAQMGGEELMQHYLWYFPMTQEVYNELCVSEEYNGQILTKYYGEGSEGQPTDEEILNYLEEEEQCYFFKHILLKVEETVSEDSSETTSNYDTQKAKAEDLLAQLRASDDPITLFDQLMKEHTEDPGLMTNPTGYLGTANPSSAIASKMVTVVEEACLNMEEGQISEVLENEEGYHGFHIVLRLPVEGNVSVSDYYDTYINDRMSQMQDQWLEDNAIVTNEHYDAIDPADVYAALGVLRDAITEEANADSEQEGMDSSASASTSKPASSAANS